VLVAERRSKGAAAGRAAAGVGSPSGARTSRAGAPRPAARVSALGERREGQRDPPEQVTKIRRLFFGEHWRAGTTATRLGLHPDMIRRALTAERLAWPAMARPS
jgi:hypothetical protein